ncbi:MAG: Bacillithiol biosynthesis deacetylase BshB1 [Bacilli bacterium]|nr:Bacillithiol biosynthesis deacetylase BshB1 [Bacilli bacterium]
MNQALDILIFGAHPDDAEIGMGATIVKHTKAGYRIGICDLTYAEMSSNGSVESRKLEADEASQLLGLTMRTNLGLPDRGLFVCREQIEAIVLEIRKFKPRIVFAPYWQDRHPDHVACSLLVQEAVFNAKLRKYLPNTEATAVDQLLFYFINDVFEADLIVDVTDDYSRKIDALHAYKTQFMPATSENDFVQTPINQGYIQRVEARDRMMGQKKIIEYAEGFVSKLPYTVNLF